MSKLWSEADISILKLMYADQSIKDICEILGRSAGGVSQKASNLGLKRGDTPEKQENWRRHSEFMLRRRDEGYRNPHRSSIGAIVLHGGRWMKKVSDTGNSHDDWRPAGRAIWEEVNGPIPDGMTVRFVDRDENNLAIENLVLLTSQEKMAINTIARYPKEFQESARALGRFLAKLKRLENEKSQ